jgi:hypothetical protein
MDGKAVTPKTEFNPTEIFKEISHTAEAVSLAATASAGFIGQGGEKSGIY